MSGVQDTVTRHTHRVCLIPLFRAKPLPPDNADQMPPQQRGVRLAGMPTAPREGSEGQHVSVSGQAAVALGPQ